MNTIIEFKLGSNGWNHHRLNETSNSGCNDKPEKLSCHFPCSYDFNRGGPSLPGVEGNRDGTEWELPREFTDIISETPVSPDCIPITKPDPRPRVKPTYDGAKKNSPTPTQKPG